MGTLHVHGQVDTMSGLLMSVISAAEFQSEITGYCGKRRGRERGGGEREVGGGRV